MQKAVWCLVAGAAVVLGACSDGGSSLALADLDDAGSSCPVDLDGALEDATVEADGEVTVEVEKGAGDEGADASVLDQVGATYVLCSVPVDDGELEVTLVGVQRGDAVNVLLPQINADLNMSVDDLQDLVERFADTDRGDFVDDALAALAPIKIADAESGVLYVHSDALTPDQIHNIAETLLDG